MSGTARPPPRRSARPEPTPPAALDQRPVTTLKGVGDALAEKLAKLGVLTVQDLLFLLPTRYEDRTSIVPIGTLRHGDRAVVEGEIELAEVVFRRRRQLLVRVTDGSGFLTLRFLFHRAAAGAAGARRAVATLRRSATRHGGA